MPTRSSNIFNYALLIDNKNADKLFKAFLEKVENQEMTPTKVFTVKEITEMIPRGSAGVNNHSTYGFSIMSMFGNQKGRDYFIFDDFDTTKLFTDLCNNSDRDNYAWRKYYMSKTCVINPKYFFEE